MQMQNKEKHPLKGEKRTNSSTLNKLKEGRKWESSDIQEALKK